jgi:hypothetical protein
LSPANTAQEMLGTLENRGNRELYFQAGAKEFWMCDEEGRLSFYNSSGKLAKSDLCPDFPERV